jgi:adenosylcobinamide-GDP ribazoletransferase
MFENLMISFKRQGYYFLVAIMFFTRIPINFKVFDDADLNKATRYFPLVGILVGVVGASIFYLTYILLPQAVAILLSMVATILLTGAFHEDGLADAVDGLGGGWSREQVLTIMVDSRIGSYGAIALVMALLSKYQALNYQSIVMIPASIIAGHSLSRLSAVLVMATQSYVKSDGKAKPLATKITTCELIIATIFGLLPLAFLGIQSLVALVPVALVWMWFSAKIKKRIGGYTGDCLGAMQQLTEIAFYIGLIASSSLFYKLLTGI